MQEVTGTEVSQHTRQRYESNHDLQKKESKEGEGMKHNSYIHFESDIPDWDGISVKTAIKYEWDHKKSKWSKFPVKVKLAPHPFDRGSLRLSIYCLDVCESQKSSSLSFSSEPGRVQSSTVSKTMRLSKNSKEKSDSSSVIKTTFNS